MSSVDTATGEIIEFDAAAAERRAERITLRLDAIAKNYRMVLPMIREAIEKRDDIALGYRSPGDYVQDRFGQSLAGLGIEVRRAVVGELTQAGLSTRAIAPVVGADHSTVVRDIARGAAAPPQSPAPGTAGEGGPGAGQTSVESDDADTSDREPTEAALSERVDCPPPAAPPVTGIDGKTYPRPRPTPKPIHHPQEDEWTAQDRAEELARNLSRNLSLLYALVNPERRAEYIATWRAGIRDLAPLGSDFITPKHMRELSAALLDFATEWENADA